MPLLQLAPSLYTHDQDLRFFGLELGARMTVIDLDGKGDLFIHSPNKLTPELKKELDDKGKANWIVSPNKWHHLYVDDFKKAYPEAKQYCAPGLDKKRKDFPFDDVIRDDQNYPWNPKLAHVAIHGTPMYNEIVFFHPPTGTLVLTDLAIHVCESNSFVTKMVFRLMGSYGKFGWSSLEKRLFIKDRAAFQESLQQILRWDFDRVILSHGNSVESGGKSLLSRTFL